jgi:hypothetical protein
MLTTKGNLHHSAWHGILPYSQSAQQNLESVSLPLFRVRPLVHSHSLIYTLILTARVICLAVWWTTRSYRSNFQGVSFLILLSFSSLNTVTTPWSQAYCRCYLRVTLVGLIGWLCSQNCGWREGCNSKWTQRHPHSVNPSTEELSRNFLLGTISHFDSFLW